ncbi:hypothetical protein IW262DRAFT_1299926 [Armillaria fumosa]|nr:hypothetical protein IW262DRAFT_1299926 [Armillaria fumosa]
MGVGVGLGAYHDEQGEENICAVYGDLFAVIACDSSLSPAPRLAASRPMLRAFQRRKVVSLDQNPGFILKAPAVHYEGVFWSFTYLKWHILERSPDEQLHVNSMVVRFHTSHFAAAGKKSIHQTKGKITAMSKRLFKSHLFTKWATLAAFRKNLKFKGQSAYEIVRRARNVDLYRQVQILRGDRKIFVRSHAIIAKPARHASSMSCLALILPTFTPNYSLIGSLENKDEDVPRTAQPDLAGLSTSVYSQLWLSPTWTSSYAARLEGAELIINEFVTAALRGTSVMVFLNSDFRKGLADQAIKELANDRLTTAVLTCIILVFLTSIITFTYSTLRVKRHDAFETHTLGGQQLH